MHLSRERLKRVSKLKLDAEEIRRRCQPRHRWGGFYEHEIAPPALSKNGARLIMKRLCNLPASILIGSISSHTVGDMDCEVILYAQDAELT
jgi:hypothetical protein